jgi:probable F420-dependent oxidoreductase
VEWWINAGFLEAEQLVPVAQAAERLGYAGITLPDHLFLPEHYESQYPYSADGTVGWAPEAPWPDCWVSIAAMAQATQRLRFGTSVFIGPLRDVITLAKSVGTCAALAPGRLMCGLGAGWLSEEFDVVGQDFATRGKRMDEMLDVLPLLWSGDVVEYQGEHISIPPLRMRPAAGDVPILVGGNTKAALRRAARVDGWIAAFTDVVQLAGMLAEYDDQRARQGRVASRGEILVTATPGIVKQAEALAALGVDGVVVAAVTLAASTATEDVVAGMERYAARWA